MRFHPGPLLLVALCLLPMLACAQQPILDAQNGFFDIQLGDSLVHFPDWKRKGSYEKKARFYNPEQELTYGDVEFVFVDYLFYEGRLHSIFIRTRGEASSKKFLELLEALYGEGEQDGMAPRFTWNGNKVSLFYDRNLLTGNADIKFTSIPVEKAFSQDYRRLGPR